MIAKIKQYGFNALSLLFGFGGSGSINIHWNTREKRTKYLEKRTKRQPQYLKSH